MSFTLRLFHILGVVCFGGFIIHDVFLILLSGGSLLFSPNFINFFYFITLPFLVVLLISGILLTVDQSYLVKNEPWLKKKLILLAGILFLLIVGIFPGFKRAVQISASNSVPPKWFVLSLIAIVVLWFSNLVLALKHQELVRKRQSSPR